MNKYRSSKKLKLSRHEQQNSIPELYRQLNRARQANLAKSKFISNISHDLRAPMQSILGMTSLANLYLGDPQRMQECLKKITQASQQLLQLINEVLDMSKIEANKIELHEIDFTLEDLLEDLKITFDRQAPQLLIKSQADVKRFLHGDRLKIHRILSNILGNACKFTPQQGLVELSIQSLGQLNANCEAFKFQIKDNGIGMNKEFLESIFQPFSRQLENNFPEGYGLGMAITKKLVEFLGGKLHINSQVGLGTTVVVILNLQISDQEEMLYNLEKAPQTLNFIQEDTPLYQAPRRILLVDDNHLNLEITSEFLRLEGFEVDTARNGAEAIEKFRLSPEYFYDLILMDIKMPVMNGYQATQAIRQLDRHDTTHLPIIAMTANAFKQDQDKSNQLGMNFHLSKPVDFTTLIQTLQRFLAKREA